MKLYNNLTWTDGRISVAIKNGRWVEYGII